MEDLNLHFTGDLHAVAAANNLLAAMLEAHLLQGNGLGIDPHSITWRRCVDMNDRSLREVVVGLGGKVNGIPRETGFDITAASEVMAILAMARDLDDLRRRLGAITVGATFDGEPVTAEQLHAAGAMTVLLKEAVKPNLVQTLEGEPALVHAGPFANIAHGNSSLVGTRVGLKLGEYVITEGGFASDLGLEKFLDIVCRIGGLSPSAVVLVATVRALEHHGDGDLGRGADNLERHLKIAHAFGLNAVVAVNAFSGDSKRKLERVRKLALERGAWAAELCEGFARGGEGATALAETVAEAVRRPTRFEPIYPLDASIAEKLQAVATRVYGADGVELLPAARQKIAGLEALGLGGLPVCMAKTHLSLSHDPTLRNAPTGFTVPVRDLRAYTGAGWVLALCGEMQTMPGLGRHPAAFDIDVAADGRSIGLF
jgi:formate--tetrahydrofolate ligase